RRGLHVALAGYRDGWTELEATLPQAPHLGPVTLDRDAAGTTCQLAWDCWADVTTPDGTAQPADAAAVLLRSLATCPSLTPQAARSPRPCPPWRATSPGGKPGPSRSQRATGSFSMPCSDPPRRRRRRSRLPARRLIRASGCRPCTPSPPTSPAGRSGQAASCR